MSTLLDDAIAAHGGWDHWQGLQRLVAHARIGGGLWGAKGKAGVLADVHVTVDAHRQHVEYVPFGAPDRHSVWEPDRTAIVTADGQVVESRENPRAAFAGHVRETQWDDQNLIYFSGYAMWTYLTTPFLFRLPGFESREIEPWEEDGQTWRRLEVIFPDTTPSHNRQQTFYFDETGVLRRHDYAADVLGGLPSANYALEPKTFDGLIVPTQRRVYARGPDNRSLKERLAVAIDILDIVVS